MIDSFNIYSSLVTKNEYESTLRAFHESQTETKNEARDKAAAVLARRFTRNLLSRRRK